MTNEKNLAAEIQGSRAANRNLSSRLKKLDQQSIKQQEIVYNQVSIERGQIKNVIKAKETLMSCFSITLTSYGWLQFFLNNDFKPRYIIFVNFYS